uniref:DNA-directed RNA polymerase subunit alpha n=1 Tax=Pantoea phage Survivor TaxID=3232176 RepID=A0AAU8KZI6_9CAUD
MSTISEILNKFSEQSMIPSLLFDKMLQDTGIQPKPDDQSFYSPLYPDFDDYDLKHDTSVTPPIYLNDFDFNIEEDRARVVELLRTEYEGNNFDTVAACQCKKYRSNSYLGSGFLCDNCGTEVVKPLTNKIETKVWLKRPAMVSGFLSPAMYAVFFSKLNTKSPKVNLVDYWINGEIRAEKRFKDVNNNAFKIAQKLEAFRATLGIDFGYNSFVENIDLIIRGAIEHDVGKVIDLTESDRLNYSLFWEKYRKKAVFKYLPLPNKITTVVESDQRDRYVNKEQTDLDKIYFTLADTYPIDDIRVEDNEELMGKNMKALVDALAEVQKNILFGKKGMIRYHAGAGKLPLTGRSIITGESGVCRSDTVVLPWLYGITCLDKHLTNWLYRKGLTPLKVKEVIRTAAYTRHPLIEEFYNWIETNRYAMITAGRNPSIQYLSARGFFCTFNRDLDDKSIRIPITTVKEFGADFDGDQMYVIFIPDMMSKIEAYSSWGHHQMLDPNKLFKTSRFATHTKTNLLNINSAFLDEPIADE